MDILELRVEHPISFTIHVQPVRQLCKFADTQYGAVEFNFATKNYPLFAVHDVQGLCEVMFIMVTSDAGGREAAEKIGPNAAGHCHVSGARGENADRLKRPLSVVREQKLVFEFCKNI